MTTGAATGNPHPGADLTGYEEEIDLGRLTKTNESR
jgi:hypothetical protein